jgi:hypothetical protein
MPSFVWGRDPQEAIEEPYEYEGQDQFVREAKALLRRLYVLLNSDRHEYTLSDTSREKASWLLAMDALDALRDCLAALTRKEHRVAGRLFRDVTETMDLAAFFMSDDPRSEKHLKLWYADKIVPNSVYRDFVKRTRGEAEQKQLSDLYGSLSRFTHRSYRVLLYGYVRARGDRLGHDRSHLLWRDAEDEGLLVLPHTISMYFAVLSGLMLEFAAELSDLALVSAADIRHAFADSWEDVAVPRRFTPRRWLAEQWIKPDGPGVVGGP